MDITGVNGETLFTANTPVIVNQARCSICVSQPPKALTRQCNHHPATAHPCQSSRSVVSSKVRSYCALL